MDTLTELTGSSLTPEEINKRVIGSLVHKNMDIRNLNLMRNIGKYPLYNFPMFPEIGMVYNVYEHLLNRPVRHYTTGNTSWSKWKSGLAGQFKTGEGEFLADDTKAINGLIEFNNDITQDLNDSEKFHIINDGEREKLVYTPNSGSMGLEGGPGLLSTVKAKINEEFAKRKSYAYKVKDFALNEDGTPRERNESDGTNSAMVGASESINQLKFYVNGDKDVIKNGPINGQFWNSVVYVHQEQDTPERNFKTDKSLTLPLNNSCLILNQDTNHEQNSSLLSKTNHLFSNGKIKSLINRYQTQDGLSRGRALLSGTSEGDAMWTNENADGYNNPWCRVWTVTKQFSTMKDLIRPFVRDNKAFYRIAEIQEEMFKNRPGLRPNGGGERLDAMGVLQSNGLPIFSPYQNNDGTIAEDSVKRCMFSIENLAWRDIKAEHKMKFGLEGDDTTTYIETETLTKEQRGPNGGRIMWFPPYNLKFTENVSAKWNNNSFLGRGEDIYTYGNTERGGTLSFTLLIDHPMVVDAWHNTAKSYTDGRNSDDGLGERRILRFFAGCDEFLNDNTDSEAVNENESINDEFKNKPIKETKPEFEEVSILIPLFYPNNYSGIDDRDNGKLRPFINYMFHGVDESDITEYRDKLLELAKNIYKSLTEKVKAPFNVALEEVQSEEEKPKREKYKTDDDWEEQKEEYEHIGEEMTLFLRDFSLYIISKIPDISEFTSDNPSHDTLSSMAKLIEERVDTFYENTKTLISEIELDLEAYEYSKTIFGTVASESLKYVKESYGSERVESKTNFMLDYEKVLPTSNNSSLINNHLYESGGKPDEGSNLITPIPYTGGRPLDSPDSYNFHYWHYKVDGRVAGESQRRICENGKYYSINGNYYKEVANESDKFANNFDNKDFGLNNFTSVDEDFEKEYGTAFAKFKINKLIYGTNLFSITNFINILEKSYSELSDVEKHLQHILEDYVENITGIDILGHASSQGNINGNDNLSKDRADTLEMLLKLYGNLEDFNAHFIPSQEGKDLSEMPDTSDKIHKLRRVSIGVIHFKLDNEHAFNELGGVNSVTAKPDSEGTTDISGENKTELKKEDNSTINIDNKETVVTKVWNYDDEYKYFQRIKEENSIVRSRILEKIQYFDPAYHSISPEGFNARLTFLHQCTRQGPSFLGDTTNMAFGRAPYCVLRIGDFYNTKIIIDSISIDYGENQWDLNPEGAGVQPIMANVNINFKFIGGSDISGPIDRLQNAVSFNYYGNASIYDRRADYRNGFVGVDASGVKSWDPEMKETKK